MQPPSDQPTPPEQPESGAPQTPPINLEKTPEPVAPQAPPDSSTNVPPVPPPFSNPAPTPSPVAPSIPPVIPSRAGTVSMDVITEAWTILKPELGMWIAAALVYGAISGAFNGGSNVVQAMNPNGESTVLLAVTFVLSILSSLVSGIIGAGLFKMAIHHVRTGKADISQMFNVFDSLGSLVIAIILTSLAMVLGLFACVIPGIIAALGFAMTSPLIVDQKMEAIPAMKRSWAAMKPNLGAFFVLCLVLGVLNIAGLCACCVGLLVTIPLSQIALALVYRDLVRRIGRGEHRSHAELSAAAHRLAGRLSGNERFVDERK
jgi:hypothetical protein